MGTFIHASNHFGHFLGLSSLQLRDPSGYPRLAISPLLYPSLKVLGICSKLGERHLFLLRIPEVQYVNRIK